VCRRSACVRHVLEAEHGSDIREVSSVDRQPSTHHAWATKNAMLCFGWLVLCARLLRPCYGSHQGVNPRFLRA
jgi:hypothetical protein